MKEPFVSMNGLLAGAAIFGIVISGAAWYGATLTPVVATNVSNAPAIVIATTTPVAVLVVTAVATSTPVVVVPTYLSLVITPATIIEGDPVMITIAGGTAASTSITNIKSVTLTAPGPNMPGRSATATLSFVEYKNVPIAFYGTGISQKTGTATVTVIMKNASGGGTTKLSANFTIGARVSPTESLPVPEQLGGNSTSSQAQLVTNLTAENAAIANVYSNPNISFWVAPFAFPVHAADIAGGIIVTDPFGYNRDSGAETIIHKGTDFKAPVGTPVYAINAGYVRMTRLFTVYGNTVVVDHGMGIQSFYMHLSKMSVTPGEPVKKRQLLGYSGETGYSEGPHLHLTIRVDGVSIDPMKFYALFGVTP
jgi:murein DD-endopeptidase MepM/ murein hydrolase activator NlpD